jgi:hypothetical protein
MRRCARSLLLSLLPLALWLPERLQEADWVEPEGREGSSRDGRRGSVRTGFDVGVLRMDQW